LEKLSEWEYAIYNDNPDSNIAKLGCTNCFQVTKKTSKKRKIFRLPLKNTVA
jgi:hypothetical protein